MAELLDILDDYGYRDIIGQITVRSGGGQAPTLLPLRAGENVKDYAFANGDVIDNITYHIPHDYNPMTPIYVHPHWAHNGTNVTGSMIETYYIVLAKRDGETKAQRTVTHTIPCDITTYPQYNTNVNDLVIANDGGTDLGYGALLDLNDIEVDDLIQVATVMTQVPTISGGSTSRVFIKTQDLHYQSTNIGTVNKDAPFYGA